MRLLVDVRFLGKGTTTGIAAYTTELLTTLLKKNHQFIFFYNGVTLEPLPSSWLTNPRVSVINWNIPNKLLQITTRLGNFPALDERTEADVIYSPNVHLLPYKNIPRVITFHDLSFVHYPSFFSRKDRLWHWWQGAFEAAQKSDHITTVSHYTKNDLVKTYGLPAEKISVIYPGINTCFRPLEIHNEQRRTVEKKYGLTKPFFLYLGTVEYRKNVALIVKAFSLLKQKAEFKDYQLVLAGKHGYGSEEVLRHAAATHCADDIIYITTLLDSERTALYNLARSFIYPSFFEGFGFPPLEAQACGVPVIASDRTSLSETLTGSALLIDPWRVDQLAQAMAQIETEQSTRERLISEGKKNAARFNWSTTADQLIDVCTRTTQQHARF